MKLKFKNQDFQNAATAAVLCSIAGRCPIRSGMRLNSWCAWHFIVDNVANVKLLSIANTNIQFACTEVASFAKTMAVETSDKLGNGNIGNWQHWNCQHYNVPGALSLPLSSPDFNLTLHQEN